MCCSWNISWQKLTWRPFQQCCCEGHSSNAAVTAWVCCCYVEDRGSSFAVWLDVCFTVCTVRVAYHTVWHRTCSWHRVYSHERCLLKSECTWHKSLALEMNASVQRGNVVFVSIFPSCITDHMVDTQHPRDRFLLIGGADINSLIHLFTCRKLFAMTDIADSGI